MSQRPRARAWRKTFGIVTLLCLVAGLSACSKKDEKKDAAKSAKTEQNDSTETSAATAPPEVNIPDEQIPTEEDFEGEAEKQIKPESNLPAELDKIEKEI